ncbi:hypothetical protein TIFTF001_041969 [Ficus carica]|uniref:Uncharacterized protein n=1 Tax=Ficus carica TaxID=3494 RepID=A0AA87ZHN9_FICCA|nr:hypothetical protein TIFTF001_041969 [Ficus carica]
MRRRLKSAKRYRRKVFITQYSRVRKALARPIASCPDPPTSTIYSSSGSNSVNLYNVFDKTHAAGAYGYGLVTMGDASNPSVDYDFNFANSETHPFLEEDVTPTAGGRQVDTRQGPDAAGPSRRSGSLGKRKQRDATEAMAFEAMEEVRDYFRGISQTGGSSEQSAQNGGLVQCMNIMKGMCYSSHHQMMMWHYFDSH